MEYLHNKEKVIKVGQKIDFEIPKPIAHISFDAYKAGTWSVTVFKDGSWIANLEYTEE